MKAFGDDSNFIAEFEECFGPILTMNRTCKCGVEVLGDYSLIDSDGNLICNDCCPLRKMIDRIVDDATKAMESNED
jgi:hypothetical protein